MSAGLIGTPAMRKLTELVERRGATLLLVGDPSQLPAVEGTPPLHFLAGHYGAPVLKEIRRQNDAWAREAARQFADGNAGQALAMFAQHKQVTVRDDFDEVVRQACLDWTEEGLLSPYRALIVANSNDLSHKANLLAQEHRLRAGCIHPSPSIRDHGRARRGSLHVPRSLWRSRGFQPEFTPNTGSRTARSAPSSPSTGSPRKSPSSWTTSKYVTVNVRKYPHIRFGLCRYHLEEPVGQHTENFRDRR